MSDFFGIGASIKGSLNILFQSMRATGRTINLVKSLKEGDRVICVNQGDVHYLKSRIRDFGIEGVEVIAKNPRNLDLKGVGTAQGRTMFDHRFVEEFYKDAIEHASNQLNGMEQHLSGYDERHIETRQKAELMAKWRFKSWAK